MSLKIIRQLNQNQREIERLKARQDTLYNDAELRSAIIQLVDRVATLENTINNLNIPNEQTITTPRWFSDVLLADVAVQDIDGATEILKIEFVPSGGQLMLLLQIGAMIASANNTVGQLDYKIDGNIVSSRTISLRNNEVFEFSQTAILDGISTNSHAFSIDLTTITAGRTLTLLASEIPSFLTANDVGIVK